MYACAQPIRVWWRREEAFVEDDDFGRFSDDFTKIILLDFSGWMPTGVIVDWSTGNLHTTNLSISAKQILLSIFTERSEVDADTMM